MCVPGEYIQPPERYWFAPLVISTLSLCWSPSYYSFLHEDFNRLQGQRFSIRYLRRRLIVISYVTLFIWIQSLPTADKALREGSLANLREGG